MISSNNYKRITIHITTLQKEDYIVEEVRKRMNENLTKSRIRRHEENGKFICSVCLNEKTLDNTVDNCKIKTRSCPICQKNCDICANNVAECKLTRHMKKEDKATTEHAKSKSKPVQTSQTDIPHGMDLLNEVLTVFQNKKQLENIRDKHKTVICKDACVSTELFTSVTKSDSKPFLTVSKLFQFSIVDEARGENCKFEIVNSCQPEVIKSLCTIDLNKQKSCSIPQMKVEELRKSLKEKTKSKDAIEEVNRMFATVKKTGHDSLDDTNRPLVRSGPRVLPVVKTKTYQETIRNKSAEAQCNSRHSCKCCQTNNYYMSGGDSFRKEDCCHKESETKFAKKQKCDKCVYMLCCHYENQRRMKTGIMICECCKEKNKQCCNNEQNDDVSSNGF